MSSEPDDQRLVLCAASRWERRAGSGYLVSPPPSTASRAHTGPGLCLWFSRDQESMPSQAEKVDEEAAVLHVGTTSAVRDCLPSLLTVAI